jgi:hypothetical protein
MPCKMVTGGYKETKFRSVCKGVGFAHSTVWIPRQHNLGRGKGQCFHRVSEEVKGGDCRGGCELQSIPETSEGTIPEGQA